VQAGHNTKRTATGVAAANELGWTDYRRVGEGVADRRPSQGTTPTQTPGEPGVHSGVRDLPIASPGCAHRR
jgi:hypothetical protein